MCALFNKKNHDKSVANELTLNDPSKKNIIEQIHELGFEVGYHHHSEMGWIKESYNKLLGSTTDDSFKDLLENYYAKGKTDGLEKKKLDLRTHSTVTKKTEDKSIPHVESTPFIENSRSLNKATQQYAPTAHASMTSEPTAVNRPIVVNLPASLNGFRPLKPYKEED